MVDKIHQHDTIINDYTNKANPMYTSAEDLSNVNNPLYDNNGPAGEAVYDGVEGDGGGYLDTAPNNPGGAGYLDTSPAVGGGGGDGYLDVGADEEK